MKLYDVPDSDVIDYKVTKTHYPYENSTDYLEIIFEKDPNLFLRKNKIAIRGTIQINKKYATCSNWASKLFSKLTVFVDSQEVSKHNIE